VAHILSFGIDQTFLQERAKVLAASGLKVSSVSQKDEALRLARLMPPDVVIFGHRVPESLRTALSRNLKKINPHARLIYLYLGATQDTEMADAVLALDSQPDQLVATIRHLTEHSSAEATA
jgi:response regulator RpfG family c-di-GMP phosphodiesterase